MGDTQSTGSVQGSETIFAEVEGGSKVIGEGADDLEYQ